MTEQFGKQRQTENATVAEEPAEWVLPLPGKSLFAVILSGVIFFGVLIAVLLLPKGKNDFWGKAGLAAMFAAIFVAMLVIYVVAKYSTIILTQKGICRTYPGGSRFIAWNDVKAFYVLPTEYDEALLIRGLSDKKIKMVLTAQYILYNSAGAQDARTIFSFCKSMISSAATEKAEDMLSKGEISYDISDKTCGLLWFILIAVLMSAVGLICTIVAIVKSANIVFSVVILAFGLLLFSFAFRGRIVSKITLTSDGLAFPAKGLIFDWKDVLHAELIGEDKYDMRPVSIILADHDRPLIITQRCNNYFVLKEVLWRKNLLILN